MATQTHTPVDGWVDRWWSPNYNPLAFLDLPKGSSLYIFSDFGPALYICISAINLLRVCIYLVSTHVTRAWLLAKAGSPP